MELVCKFYPKKYKDLIIEIDENSNLTDLISRIRVIILKRENLEYPPHIEVCERYYNGKTVFGEYYLPYILNEHRIVEWNKAYNEIKIKDLIRTFNSKNVLKFDILIGVGGITELVNNLQNVWEVFTNVVAPLILICDAVDALKKIKNFLIGKKCRPVDFITYIYSKNNWSLEELSEQTKIEKEELKSILKGFGYKWDRRKLKYIKTQKSKELYLKLDNKYNDIQDK